MPWSFPVPQIPLLSAANALLHKCNALWEATLRKLAAAADEGGGPLTASESVLGGEAMSNGGDEGVVDVSRSPVFDLRFFRAAMRSVNELPGSDPRWSEEGLSSGADQALEFFCKGQVWRTLSMLLLVVMVQVKFFLICFVIPRFHPFKTRFRFYIGL